LLAVLGDSLTAGFPFGEGVSWLSVLAERLGARVLNGGVCGETTADMLRRAGSLLTEDGLTHFLVFGGANDLLIEGRAAAAIARDLHAIQRLALARGLKTGCVLPLVPAVDEAVTDFLALRDKIARDALPDVLLLDLQAAFRPETAAVNYLDDGVHLSIEGNRALGEYAAGQLRSWLFS
jgi:lysophospholipase L1-like esterase